MSRILGKDLELRDRVCIQEIKQFIVVGMYIYGVCRQQGKWREQEVDGKVEQLQMKLEVGRWDLNFIKFCNTYNSIWVLF